jgi:hypothetical protein
VSAASLLPDPVWTFPCHFTFCDIWPLGQCHLLCGPFRCWSEAVFRLALGFTFPALETLSPVCCTLIHHSGWIRSLGPSTKHLVLRLLSWDQPAPSLPGSTSPLHPVSQPLLLFAWRGLRSQEGTSCFTLSQMSPKHTRSGSCLQTFPKSMVYPRGD